MLLLTSAILAFVTAVIAIVLMILTHDANFAALASWSFMIMLAVTCVLTGLDAVLAGRGRSSPSRHR